MTTYPASHHVEEGTVVHSIFMICEEVNGQMSRVAHRNIHLFTVNTEYFLMRLLKSERYKAKDSWAPKHMISPRMSPTLEFMAAILVRISMMAPQQPMNTPRAFFRVIGSFRMMKDKSIAKIGIDVVQMLELTGEVMLSPMVYRH